MRHPLVFTLLLVIIVAIGTACRSEATGQGHATTDATTDPTTGPTADPTTDPTMQSVTAQRVHKAPMSGIQDARRVVIRDPTAWSTLWAEAVTNMAPPPELPPVDFSEAMLIAVAMGTRASGGHEISIDDVHRSGEALVVAVREVAPGPLCFTTQAFTAPVDIVQIPKSEEPIRFEEEADTLNCN